ncbi:MAG: 7-carboxy-7-deazaguanine synthase QueE [Campylobacterales bacterium]|nr:7-carboxy-7-deazaguanine synthase QueE [Campylobacterales bacterium]
MLYLVEHFYSIQGEGRYVGTPSLFFRLGGCNMRCEGFGCVETAPDGVSVVGCDTVYAVDRHHFGDQWQGIEDWHVLLGIMQSYDLPDDVDVVFTGGEPLLYAHTPQLVAFVEYLISRHHRVTFETNGSVAVDFERHRVYKSCVFALSVKLSNSGEPYEKRVRPEVFGRIITQADEAFFKFTVDSEALEREIETITAEAPKCQVMCMPKGGSKAEVEANTEATIELCKRKGYTYSDRLHIRIWDQNKGV